MRRIALFLLSALAFSGCSAILGSDEPEGLEIRAAAPVYTEQPARFAEVGFTVTNRGDEAVRLSRCGSRITAVVERREGAAWEQVSGGFCIADLSSLPMELAPGAAAAGSVVIPVERPGTYRLSVRFTRPGEDDPVAAYSGPITLQ